MVPSPQAMAAAAAATAAARVRAGKQVRDVWEWNFNAEFASFLHTTMMQMIVSGGYNTYVALDMEFPGFAYQSFRESSREVKYEALRRNIDGTWPIQVGIALSGLDGVVRDVWCFNLRFDIKVDGHTKEALDFLTRAGVDFARHKQEGIDSRLFGRRLAQTILVGPHSPVWVTFGGQYDLGYLLKLLLGGGRLPPSANTFEGVLSHYIPWKHDLQEYLGWGSLEGWGKEYGIERYGQAHTAGSDALLTMELYIKVMTKTRQESSRHPSAWSTWNYPWDSEASSEGSNDGWNYPTRKALPPLRLVPTVVARPLTSMPSSR